MHEIDVHEKGTSIKRIPDQNGPKGARGDILGGLNLVDRMNAIITLSESILSKEAFRKIVRVIEEDLHCVIDIGLCGAPGAPGESTEQAQKEEEDEI